MDDFNLILFYFVIHMFTKDLYYNYTKRNMQVIKNMCSFGNICDKVAKKQTRTYVSIS